MRDIFFFDNMLTPKVITFVYWLALLGVLLAGFGFMFAGGFSFSTFVGGILYWVFGAIAARIWCELLIVLFKMNEALQELRNK